MKNKSIIPALILLLIIPAFIISCKNIDSNVLTERHEKIKVGVFDGNGASVVCVLETLEALKADSGIEGQVISAAEISSGKLEQFDVLIFPGGSGSKEYNNLGQAAEIKVKEFVKSGHGLVGICAGGYLLANTNGYPSLKMLEVSNIRDHYNRGRGLIGFTLNEEGEKIFPELKDIDTAYVQYYDGPIYRTDNTKRINSLATITSDIATHEKDPKGVTPGKSAFLTQEYGQGKIFVSVGHPESTPGMRWIVPRMVRWVNNNEIITYSEKVVRPHINQKEILYDPDVIKFEKENFWKLFNEDKDTVITAINNLHKIRSRPSIRWTMGLLRHTEWEVRLAAAEYLLETEYTASIEDIKTAVEMETNPEQKEELNNVYLALKNLAL